MSTSSPPPTDGKSYFEQQREQMITQIAMEMENVLMKLNTLNRNLEGCVTVGREFEAVEELWARFEGVMGRGDAAEKEEDTRDE